MSKTIAKPLYVQVHVGWLNTMTTNNYCCLLERTYLSFDYTNKITKGEHVHMNTGQRGAAKDDNKPLPQGRSLSIGFTNAEVQMRAKARPSCNPSIFNSFVCH